MAMSPRMRRCGSCAASADQIQGLFLGGSGLALLGAEVDLDEDVGPLAEPGPLAVDLPGEREAVHRVDERDLAAQVLDLVALKPADKMPFHGAADLFDLGGELLDVAFAEQKLSGRGRFLDHGRGLGLGDRHQAHGPRVAPAAGAGGGDMLVDMFDIG